MPKRGIILYKVGSRQDCRWHLTRNFVFLQINIKIFNSFSNIRIGTFILDKEEGHSSFLIPGVNLPNCSWLYNQDVWISENNSLKYAEKAVSSIDECMDRSSWFGYLTHWEFACTIYFISMHFIKEGSKGVLQRGVEVTSLKFTMRVQ